MPDATVQHSTPAQPYVLGTGDDELARLGLQHRLWADAATSAWKAAGIGVGSRVLDVGCGPGFATLDLADLVTPSGKVVGVDESDRFARHLTQQARARGASHVLALTADVQALPIAAATDLAPGSFDAAYARWVLCFTPRPQDVVAGVAKLLRPGGRFVMHDYFCYESMTMAPRRASFDVLVRATGDSWRSRGGDPDVMSRVPALLSAAGLELVSMQVHQRVARGGMVCGHADPMLGWLLSWWRTFAPKLVDMGRITREQCDTALRDIHEAAGDADQFFVCPPVYEMIAEKR